MELVGHLWFDFSQTLTILDKGKHEALRYEAYSEIVGKPITDELKTAYEALYKEKKSHSAVFVSLGKPVSFWSERYAAAGAGLYALAEPDIPDVLQKLRSKVPISVFSNVLAENFLPSLGIAPEWFSHILGPKEVTKPKPDLQGFELMVQYSQLPAHEILFIGDDVEKEIRPAKSVGLKTGIMWIDAPEADYSFRHFKEILPLVGA
jgi:FMN phosphatase YigB (HAD superfamily)